MNARAKLLAERQTGLGGSDIGKIYNLDRGCFRALVYEKRGVELDYPEQNKPEYERGQMLEDDALELYERRTGEEIETPGGVYRKTFEPHMLVHLDGIRTRDRAVIEVKVVNKWTLARMKKSGLLASYVLQMQHAIYVMAANRGVFVVLCPDPWELAYFEVERDEAIIERLIQDEDGAWKNVTEGPLPEKLPDGDARCDVCVWRKTCKGIESFIRPEDKDREGREIERDDSLAALANECLEADDLKKEAEEIYEEARARMKAAIGSRHGVIVAGSRWTVTRSTPERWDTRALQDALPILPILKGFKKLGKETITLRGRRTAD
jgi:predicted phage-related endonuclease